MNKSTTMITVSIAVFELVAIFIFYSIIEYFWGIYPLDHQTEHLRETIGDIQLIYLIIGLAFFFLICISCIWGNQMQIMRKLDQMEKEVSVPKKEGRDQ